jgi:hypothetical protein
MLTIFVLSTRAWCLQFIILQKYDTPDSEQVTAIAADGSLLAGSSGGSAVVWNALGQVSPKGAGVIWDMNAAGTVFVGATQDGYPAIWKNGNNAEPILETNDEGEAFSVTADGLTSVGLSDAEEFIPSAVKFNHTSREKAILLSDVAAEALRVTPDGVTVVGYLQPGFF